MIIKHGYHLRLNDITENKLIDIHTSIYQESFLIMEESRGPRRIRKT